MKLNTTISIKLGKHTYTFNLDLMKYNELLDILQFKDILGDEVHLHNISKTTIQSFLATLEILYNNKLKIGLCTEYQRYFGNKKLELDFMSLYEIDDSVYLESVAFLENKIYVLVRNTILELDVTELKKDTNFIELIKEKYYKLGE